MRRASQIRRAGTWDASVAADRVVLDSNDRHLRRIVLTGERGLSFLLDLPRPAMLKDGDALVLDDTSMVRVVGRPEPLIEIEAATPQELARLAWHIGNRHVDLQLVGGKLRIRRDHVLEAMLRGLGAKVTAVEAPFDPEPGAYGHEHEPEPRETNGQ
jgi:urease accessory protein